MNSLTHTSRLIKQKTEKKSPSGSSPRSSGSVEVHPETREKESQGVHSVGDKNLRSIERNGCSGPHNTTKELKTTQKGYHSTSGGMISNSRANLGAGMGLEEALSLLYRKFPEECGDPDRNLSAKLEDMASCGNNFTIFTHDVEGCGAKVAVPITCKSKLCRSCYRRWSSEAQKKIQKRVRLYQYPAHLVLSQPNDHDLELCLDRISESWKSLRKKSFFKEHIKHGVKSFGFTYTKEKGWHVHLHCIIDSRWIPIKKLTALWTKIVNGVWGTDHGNIHTDLKRGYNKKGLTREVVKGTDGDMKKLQNGFKDNHSLFLEFFVKTKGMQFYTYFGKRINVEGDDQYAVCPGCGRVYRGGEWEREKVGEGKLAALRMGCRWFDFYDGFEYVRGSPEEKSKKMLGEFLSEV